jgi:hypothetical protein
MRMAEQMRNRGEALPDDPVAADEPAADGPTAPESARPGRVGRLFRRG